MKPAAEVEFFVTVNDHEICKPVRGSLADAHKFYENHANIAAVRVDRVPVALYVLTATGYWERVAQRMVGGPR
jgi:hypothetical protein